MEALAWIGQLAEWFGKFIPRWVIFSPSHGGVKFVAGKRAVPLGAGIHWYWPARTVLFEYPLARQADNLATQTITTEDNKTIAAGGMIVYEVKDIVALISTCHDPQSTIRDLTLSAIHDTLCRHTWAQIRQAQQTGQLDVVLRQKAAKHLKSYGVRVLKVMLTDLAPCRVYKVMQSTSRDEDNSVPV